MTDIIQGGHIEGMHDVVHRLNDLKDGMEKVVVQSACFGLMSYTDDMTADEYEAWRTRRKESYRRAFYGSQTKEEMRERELNKCRKLFNDLRQKWFKTKCSGQCMDFNCSKCTELRETYREEMDSLSLHIQNLETPV